MEMAVLGKAYTLGYIIQTTLLGLVFFLLTFMGYLKQSFRVFNHRYCYYKRQYHGFTVHICEHME